MIYFCFLSHRAQTDQRAEVVDIYNEKVSEWLEFEHDALENTSFYYRILSPVTTNKTIW